MNNLNNLNNKNLNSTPSFLELDKMSNFNITYLSEIVKGDNKKQFKIGYYYYFKIQVVNNLIFKDQVKDFLQILNPKNGYIVLPLLLNSSRMNINTPIVSLSTQILVTRNSNSALITNFLIEKLELLMLSYGIENLEDCFLYLKYRSISLNKDEISKISKISRLELPKIIQAERTSEIKSPLYNGNIIPLTMNLDSYGTSLSKLFTLYFTVKILLYLFINNLNFKI